MIMKVTIKDYSALKGISTQAVYKQIREKKLDVIEETENGKTVKYIVVQEQEPENKSKLSDDLQEEIIKNYCLQIEMQAKQIEQLNIRIAELTELLRVSQQIQAVYAQKIIGDKTPKLLQEQTENNIPEPKIEESKEKKRSFFSWFRR